MTGRWALRHATLRISCTLPYQEAIAVSFRAGVAAAQAVLLVGIFAVFVVWQYRLLSRKDGYGPS
jgi:ABC-type sugar transport system permease subunit